MDFDVPEGYVLVPKEPAVCPVCSFRTKENGRLLHDRDCKMRPKERPDDSDVTDAMRHAAWTIYPDADIPYTEIYRAMVAAK